MEIVRFFLSGVLATIGNLTTVWFSRPFASYELSLAMGVFVGFCISFLLSKLFVFRSKQWRHARGEIFRFLVVYGAGVVVYWILANLSSIFLIAASVDQRAAEMMGAFIGASSMALTSYLGGKYFTYLRTANS